MSMTVLLVILIVLAAVFGVGAVLKGIAWAFVVALVLVSLAVWAGWRKLTR